MQSFFVVSCFSLFLAVQSLVIDQRPCVSPDVITIAQQVTQPHYFCAWYLSDGRTRSPIPGINTDALLNACRCVVSAEPIGANAKSLAAIAEAARLHSFVSATCPNTPGNPISEQFKDPSSFCAFYNSYERYDSPIPNLNVPAVRHACKCVLSGPGSSSQTSSTKRPISTTKQLISRRPSSSTKKPSAKTSSIGIIKSSSQSTAQRSSSKTSPSKIPSSAQTSLAKSSTRSSTIRTSSGKTSTTKASSSKVSSSKNSSTTSSLAKTSSHKTSSNKMISSTTSSNRSPASTISSSRTSSKSSMSTRSIFSSTTSTPGVINTSLGYLTQSRSSISSSSSASRSIARPTPIIDPYAPCGNQPYGSVWANATNQYKLYCNNYDIEGAEMFDYWIGMWRSIKQCDARAACTGVKCHGIYCKIYFGPLTLVPASSGSVALRIMPDAYEMITSNDLEAFCTTYLGYTTPSVTETTTFFANATRTAVFNLTATSTIAALTTKTDFVETVIVTSTLNASTITAPIKKRALETPKELDSYPETEIRSGCSRAATKPATTTVLETITISSTKDVSTTTTAVAYKNITSVVTELATSTTTVLINATSSKLSSATCTPTPKVDAEQQAKDLSALDFLFSHNDVQSMLSSFPTSDLGINDTPFTGDVLPPIQLALQNWVPCTATSYNISTQLLACSDYQYSMGFAACIIYWTSPYVEKKFSAWPNRPVPVSAIAKVYTDVKTTTVGYDGVPITPEMSLLEVVDHAISGGRWHMADFRHMLYYFGEYNSLL